MLKKLLLCSVLMGATSVFATAGVSDEAVKIFGTAEAKERVAKGALFIDGEFIRGPYSVTREGNVILVNGKIASRFTVKARAEEDEPKVEETVTEEAVEEETATEESAEEVADSSDEMPTLDESDFDSPAKTTQTSTIEKKLAGKSGGIEAKLAAKQKKKDLKKQSQGTFNTGSSYDPEALFEEADYTYTPPSKPEPKAVPYIRPEAALSAKERAEKAKAKDAEIAARSTKRDEADDTADVDTVDETDDTGDTDVAVSDDSTETFGDLSDVDVKRYTAAFDKRRALIEAALKRDYLVFLSSASSGMAQKPRNIMWNFVQTLPDLCEADSSKKLMDKWGTVFPRSYLQRIYENREKNATSMKILILRVKREAKAAKERSRNRI